MLNIIIVNRTESNIVSDHFFSNSVTDYSCLIYVIDVTAEDTNSKLVDVVAEVGGGVGKCLQLLSDMFRHLHCHKSSAPRFVLCLVMIVLKYW